MAEEKFKFLISLWHQNEDITKLGLLIALEKHFELWFILYFSFPGTGFIDSNTDPLPLRTGNSLFVVAALLRYSVFCHPAWGRNNLETRISQQLEVHMSNRQ